jgi:hypothetical protein
LEPSEFRRLVRHGLGRAVLHLQQNDFAPYVEIVVEACLGNDVYDQQINGSRAIYLWDLIEAASARELVLAKIIERFGDAAELSSWISWLLARYADAGYVIARKLLDEALERDPTDPVLIEAVIQITGMDGLHRVGQVLTRYPLDDEDARYAAESALEDARRLLGSDAIQRREQDVSVTPGDDALASLVARTERKRINQRGTMSAEELRRHRRIKDPSTIPFKDVWSSVEEQVEGGRVRSFALSTPNGYTTYREWAKRAPQIEIEHAAYELIARDPGDAARASRYAWIFAWRPFPLDPQHLLDIVDTHMELAPEITSEGVPDDPHAWATHSALYALSRCHDPRIRAQIIRVRQRPDGWRRYWSLLFRENYEPGDEHLARESMQSEADEDVIHGWGTDLLEAIEADTVADSTSLLELIYERTPCAHCRGNAVRALHRLNALPDWITEECHFDSDEDTRAFIAALDGGS